MPSAPPPTPLRRLGVQSEQLDNLILWTSPAKSGAALGVATVVFGILQFATVNLIAVGAYAALFAVLGAFVYGNLAGFLHYPPIPVPRLLKEGVSETEVKAYAERGTAYLNRGLAVANRLACGREPMLSGLAVGLLYLVARAASVVSLLGLAYGALLLLFTLPKLYEMRKDEIDGALDRLRMQSTAIYDAHLHKWVAKIPRFEQAAPAESTSKKEE